MNRKWPLYTVAWCCLLLAGSLAAQPGYMSVKGKVVLAEKGLPGAKVVLFKNNTKVDEILTNASGKYAFTELWISPEGDTYIIQISKPGHITVKHRLSTKAPDERKTVFPDYFPEVELFKTVKEVEREKALSAILEKPISKFAYSESKGDFADDRAYFSTIKAQVNQLFEILDAEDRERRRLLAEYRLKQAAEQQVAEEEREVAVKDPFEVEYNLAIAEADQSFEQKKYRKAMEQYKDVMALVSKSGLDKAKRDKLKKHPKRRIYDLESLMAGLSEKELEDLEHATVKEPDVDETVDEPASDEIAEAEKVEAEAETAGEELVAASEVQSTKEHVKLQDALKQRDLMLQNNMEEVKSKRHENLEKSAAAVMLANTISKEHEISVSAAKKQAENVTQKNKEIAALRNRQMLMMLGGTSGHSSAAIVKVNPTASFEERPGTGPATKGLSTLAAEKDKKDLERTVVIVHNRIKVADTQIQEKPTTKNEVRSQPFKPKIVHRKEESLYKTVTSTIITYPIKQDTLQQVDYLWGASYYYQNTREIDEDTYHKVLKNLK